MFATPDRRPRLSYANITATLALLLAASTGGAYAHGMVGSAQIRDNAVKSRHIDNGHVKTADLAAAAVGPGKLKDGAVTQTKLADASVKAGHLGSIVVVSQNSGTVANNVQTGATATCPAGTVVISGGFDAGNAATSWRVQRSHRDGNGWRAFGANQTGADGFLTARAYCLSS